MGSSLPRRRLVESLNQFDVSCRGQAPLDDQQMNSIRSFVRSGHGLLMAGLGWGWLQLNPGKSMHDPRVRAANCTDLGLPTARRIVAEHGGRIEVTSKPGNGSIFSIVLPADDSPSNSASRVIRPN